MSSLDPQVQALAQRLADPLAPLLMQRVYQEGAWTPALQGSTAAGSLTYNISFTVGRFVRIGALVFITARIIVTAIAVAPVGVLQITGLPYAARASDAQAAISVGYVAGYTLAQQLVGYVASGQARIDLIGFVSGGAPNDTTAAGLSASTDIIFSAVYETA